MEKLPSEAFSHYQSADWNTIGKELIAFAEWWSQNYWWRYGTNVLPRGRTLEDIVQEVIVKAIIGKRVWDPARGPLLPWLKDQVKSELDALVKSAAHRREILFSGASEKDEMVDKIEHHAVANGILGNAQLPDPEMAMIEQEDFKYIENNVAKLFEAVSGESELEDVLQAVLSGCEPKPRYLAEALAVPIADINNRLKRLRRRALSIEVRE